jgi:hypothetical protein
MRSVESLNNSTYVASNGSDEPIHGIDGLDQENHNHLNLIAIPNFSMLNTPRPPNYFERHIVLMFTRGWGRDLGAPLVSSIGRNFYSSQYSWWSTLSTWKLWDDIAPWRKAQHNTQHDPSHPSEVFPHHPTRRAWSLSRSGWKWTALSRTKCRRRTRYMQGNKPLTIGKIPNASMIFSSVQAIGKTSDLERVVRNPLTSPKASKMWYATTMSSLVGPTKYPCVIDVERDREVHRPCPERLQHPFLHGNAKEVVQRVYCKTEKHWGVMTMAEGSSWWSVFITKILFPTRVTREFTSKSRGIWHSLLLCPLLATWKTKWFPCVANSTVWLSSTSFRISKTEIKQ